MLISALKCIICGRPLQGRQSLFCGRGCKNRHTNYHHQSYLAQKRRGRSAKLELMALRGNKCTICGYSRNHAALEFHHSDPVTKKFQLDQRSLANRSWEEIMEEMEKCILVCANCHAEIHHPDAAMNLARSA
jgi:hypothetical protein